MLQVAADDCLCACRCVLELHAIASKKEEGKGRFAVAMTAQENERFLRSIQKDRDVYYGMLGRVNAETSDCSRASDRESIHETFGVAWGLRSLAARCLELWRSGWRSGCGGRQQQVQRLGTRARRWFGKEGWRQYLANRDGTTKRLCCRKQF